MRPAIFFDRDGVLNTIVERDGKPASPRNPDELVIVQEAPLVIAEARARGFQIFVVTNQPDVSRGLMSDSALDAIHAKLAASLDIDEIAACRHDNADDCTCRKPKPGLILGLAAAHDVELAASFMIGDQDRDITCGKAAGVRTVLLSRPYNSGAGADHVLESLSQLIAVMDEA
jgi:D-glycero-D-manno-heptose 1,7-bisphosphate phosphatase